MNKKLIGIAVPSVLKIKIWFYLVRAGARCTSDAPFLFGAETLAAAIFRRPSDHFRGECLKKQVNHNFNPHKNEIIPIIAVFFEKTLHFCAAI
ncbi:MAG: hypothetical protein ACK4NS_12380 [Saprospiraceae bacterium]